MDISLCIISLIPESCGKIATEVDAEKFFSHAYDPGNFQHGVYVFDADYGKNFKDKEKNGNFILRPLVNI